MPSLLKCLSPFVLSDNSCFHVVLFPDSPLKNSIRKIFHAEKSNRSPLAMRAVAVMGIVTVSGILITMRIHVIIESWKGVEMTGHIAMTEAAVSRVGVGVPAYSRNGNSSGIYMRRRVSMVGGPVYMCRKEIVVSELRGVGSLAGVVVKQALCHR